MGLYYGLLMIAGIAVSAMLWRRNRAARALPPIIFIGGLISAVIGAKLGYIVCELPFHIGKSDFWGQALVGRTVIGGLLGGYVGVEWGKRAAGHHSPTGDGFAIAVPVGLAIGRIGCFLNGCCAGRTCESAWYSIADAAGVHRLPAPLIEAGFNIIAAVVLAMFARAGLFRDQLFHVFMMAYGLFRIAHEPLRDTPRIGFVGTYQLLAGVLVVVGVIRFLQRRQRFVIAGAPCRLP